MEAKELIVVDVFCTACQIEITLLDELEEFGLIQMHYQNGLKYIDWEHLPQVEKIIRFHNDLKINKEGIEIILELMARLDEQNAKLRYLEAKIKLYE